MPKCCVGECQKFGKPVRVFYGVEDPDAEASANLTCLLCAKSVLAGPTTAGATLMTVTKASAAYHTTTRAMEK